MKQLPVQYSKNTFNYSLVSREQDVAIYSQTIPETGKIIAYEVFEVVKQAAMSLNGHDYPAKEVTPANNQWGNLGFTFYDLSSAKAKQAVLLQRQIDRAANKSIKPLI